MQTWAVTIYEKATGKVVDYVSFNSEWEAVSYGRIVAWADEQHLAFKVRKLF